MNETYSPSTGRALKGPAQRLLFVLTCLFLCGADEPQRDQPVDISQYDFREGDVLLQQWDDYLGDVIADVTRSRHSHCGMVVDKDGQPHVIEAVGAVRIIPIQQFLKQGRHRQFTQLRPRNLSRAQIDKVVREAKRLLGRPYDLQYQLDDEKIYCSELVYKAFQRGADIEVGEKERLGDLNWKPHRLFIRLLAGGELPLDRVMVTPASAGRSKHLKLVYSTFPPSSDEPTYDVTALAGAWRGDYTIAGKTSVSAAVRFAGSGEFESGSLQTSPENPTRIRSIQVTPFRESRDFSATLVDARNVRAQLQAQIRAGGQRIIGTWRDDLGNSGLFSFEKTANE